MDFITEAQREQLLQNGSDNNRDKDHYPVAKIYTPGHRAVWLLIDIDPEDSDYSFALSDLGSGFPEFKYVSLHALELNRQAGLLIEQDFSFQAKYPISVYAKAARQCGFITEDDDILSAIAAKQKADVITLTDLVVELDINPAVEMFVRDKLEITDRIDGFDQSNQQENGYDFIEEIMFMTDKTKEGQPTIKNDMPVLKSM